MRFANDQRGFSGAETALILAFALAITAVVGYLVRGGGDRAGSDARRVLSQGLGAGGPLAMAGMIELPRADSTRVGAIAQPSRFAEPGAVARPAPPEPHDGCGQAEGAAGGNGSPPAEVARLAPLVYLHPDEQYGPMGAQDFINHSELRWAHDSGCRDAKKAGRCAVSAAGLGDGGYSDGTSNALCMRNDDSHSTTDRTRPHDSPLGGEGFFLDLDNGHRGGTGTGAPVYYESVPGKSVTYWFFYGYSQPPGPDPITGRISHEGDWERVTILLDERGQPKDAVFYAHEGSCSVPWSQVERSGGRPVIYSAEGSHASYPSAGGHASGFPGIDDRAARGDQWRTWNNLRDVRTQPWYGFGGAWGEVGEFKETTGPLGPSPYKGGEIDETPPRCS